MPTDITSGIPASFYILPVIYTLLIVAVLVVVLAAVWRLMKAQEATARALHRIATAFEQRRAD